jgi:hypothetical protein
MPKKEKAFDCVEMKRQAQARIAKELEGMTLEEELAYWAERTRAAREWLSAGREAESADRNA